MAGAAGAWVFTVMVAADSSPATGGFPLVGDGDADVVELLDMLVSTSSLPAGSLERGIVFGSKKKKKREKKKKKRKRKVELNCLLVI